MTLQMFLVLAVTAIVFFGFVRERQPPDVTALLGVSLLLVIGATFVNAAAILLTPNRHRCRRSRAGHAPGAVLCWTVAGL